jgi:prolyl-tRNA editing enzyme YbaK/EbsC (Cys-tRNA(Pro) deacylase)
MQVQAASGQSDSATSLAPTLQKRMHQRTSATARPIPLKGAIPSITTCEAKEYLAQARPLRNNGQGVADRIFLAVTPASYHVNVDKLTSAIGHPTRLATEGEFSSLFPDCEIGAIPPLGEFYASGRWSYGGRWVREIRALRVGQLPAPSRESGLGVCRGGSACLSDSVAHAGERRPTSARR